MNNYALTFIVQNNQSTEMKFIGLQFRCIKTFKLCLFLKKHFQEIISAISNKNETILRKCNKRPA